MLDWLLLKTGKVKCMAIVAWIAFGLTAGILTKIILNNKDSANLIMTTAFGIAGAVIGGFISAQIFPFDALRQFDPRSMVIAISGAVIVLSGYGLTIKMLASSVVCPK